jgi:hypothetical protein
MSFAIYFMYDLYSYVVHVQDFIAPGELNFCHRRAPCFTHPSPSRQPVERIKAMQLARYDSCEKCGLMECLHEDI